MRIPASFELHYDAHHLLVEQLRERAEPRLRVLCANNGWLFDHRIKLPESVLAKLQLGELASIDDMKDFYAAMVVVPTRAQIDDAVRAVADAFHDATRKERAPGDPEAFVYDDVHVICSLGPLGVTLDPTGLVGSRLMEVQIRTGLQYSWWKATHDQLYKGSDDYQLKRLAAELRAQLQGVDRQLSDLAAAAAAVELPEGLEPDEEARRLLSLQEFWPASQRADDPQRFIETARVYLGAAGLDAAGARVMLQGERGAYFIADADVTPAQVLLLLAVEDQGAVVLESLRREGRRVFVTEEMERHSALLASLPEDDRVGLAPSSPTVSPPATSASANSAAGGEPTAGSHGGQPADGAGGSTAL